MFPAVYGLFVVDVQLSKSPSCSRRAAYGTLTWKLPCLASKFELMEYRKQLTVQKREIWLSRPVEFWSDAII
jgi:hypothetical protein